MPARLLLAAALAIGCHAALAQAPSVPPAVNVQRLAPQLVPFAGSEVNFQSLVNGLANGTQVQLVTVLPNGFVQSVSFTPTTPLTPTQIAQVLETARQQLIGLGIGAPTAEQLGFALMGGVVPTALGGSQVPGALESAAKFADAAEPRGADPESGQRRRDRADHHRARNYQQCQRPDHAGCNRRHGLRDRHAAAPQYQRQSHPGGGDEPQRDAIHQRQPDGEHERQPVRHHAAAGTGRRIDAALRRARSRRYPSRAQLIAAAKWAACSTSTAGCGATRAWS